MSALQLTFINEPPAASHIRNPATEEHLEHLIVALEQAAGLAVRRVTGFLHEVLPSAGFILLAPSARPVTSLEALSPDSCMTVASRVVPVGISHVGIFDDLLERFSLPAAVDALSLAEWISSKEALLGAWGPHGLRTVGLALGATCLRRRRDPQPFESGRYCRLHGPLYHGLPHLLADYLRAVGGERPNDTVTVAHDPQRSNVATRDSSRGKATHVSNNWQIVIPDGITLSANLEDTSMIPWPFPDGDFHAVLSGPPGGPLSFLVWSPSADEQHAVDGLERSVRRVFKLPPGPLEMAHVSRVLLAGLERDALCLIEGQGMARTGWCIARIDRERVSAFVAFGCSAGREPISFESILSHPSLRLIANTLAVVP